MDRDEQPADPVAGLGDLARQIRVESGEHSQGTFLLVGDLEAAWRVRYGEGFAGDDERVLVVCLAIPGYMSAMRRSVRARR